MLSVEFIIGTVGLAITLAFAIVLIQRRLHLDFPFFTIYLSSIIVTAALDLWFLAHRTTSFFSFYWVTEAISGILELLVLREAFMPSLWMEYKQTPWLRLIPPAALALIVGTALWRAVYRPYRQGPFVHLAAGAYTFELGVNLLEILVFVFALRLVRREFHPIRHLQRFAIVAGLGCMACANLLPDLVRLKAYNTNSHAALALDAVLRHLPPAAYVGVAVVWLIIFLRPLPAKTPATADEIQRRLQWQRKIQKRIRPDGNRAIAAFRQ